MGDYLGDDVWTVFLVGGQQVAAWSEGELVVHCSGIWDQPFDEVPHTRVPWSWLLVGLEDERGGGSLEIGIHVPEHLLEGISRALIDLGADVDNWVGHAQSVGLPVAGPDIPLYLRHGAAMARAAGLVVLHPPASL